MDHVRCRVQKPTLATVDDLTLLVHADEIRGFDQAEGDTERIHPECCWIYGIAQRYMACDSFVITVLAEDTECG